MDADELGQFMAALQSEKTLPDWRDFFELSLWTGARRANVEAMRWSHINLETKTWVIPADESKNGKAMPLPLSPPAMEILTRRLNERQERTSILATARTKRAMRQRDSLTQNADFVFPSKGKSGHIVEPKKAWADMLQRAGIENLHVHDLRRTLGSWQAAGGTSLQIIGKSLGHKSQKATEIYSRLNLDPVRDSVNKATAAMQKAINKEGTR
jgi:integrase